MPTDDAMRQRVRGNRLKLWLLLGANRLAVAALMLSIVFVALAAIVAVDPRPLGEVVTNSDPIETLFQAMLTAIVTGVTLVVTINQLVLSQELGAVGDQRERMIGALEYRENVADELEVPASPPEPAPFLGSILHAMEDRAHEFGDAVSTSDQDTHEEVATFVDRLVDDARAAGAMLDGAEFGTFSVVQAALQFNYSLKIYEGKRLQSVYGSDAPDDEQVFDDETSETLDSVIALLEQFGLAREHIKTLYFQWALVDLGRAMLYSSVPALVVTIGSLIALDDGGTVAGSTLGVANLTWIVLLATTVALAPFAILLSYVLRIGTVAKHTLAIGPFVLRKTDRPHEVVGDGYDRDDDGD